MSVAIRPVREEDLRRLSEIEAATFPDPWPKSSFAYLVRKEPDLFLVAVDGDRVVGYVVGEVREVMMSGLSHQFKVGHILNIAVDTEERLRGVGTLLLDEIEERLRRRNATKATLEVRESNLVARAFYMKKGYEEIGRVRSYYRDEDAIIMGKSLAAASA